MWQYIELVRVQYIGMALSISPPSPSFSSKRKTCTFTTKLTFITVQSLLGSNSKFIGLEQSKAPITHKIDFRFEINFRLYQGLLSLSLKTSCLSLYLSLFFFSTLILTSATVAVLGLRNVVVISFPVIKVGINLIGFSPNLNPPSENSLWSSVVGDATESVQGDGRGMVGDVKGPAGEWGERVGVFFGNCIFQGERNGGRVETFSLDCRSEGWSLREYGVGFLT